MLEAPPLPEGLPIPEDDGACDHLIGMRLPPVTLMSSSGRAVNMAALSGLHVIYIYPMSGEDDSVLRHCSGYSNRIARQWTAL